MNLSTAVALIFPPIQEDDFAAFGVIESVPVSRIQELTATYLTRNLVTIPHVTHHDEADIS
ncbi:hypothetical protein, partial [Pseudomonas brassicacearum]|uniref:hypothetical protein n=1 Tax=Pseudomonas brassicacearum TaxID=930166 RepID=UPI001C832411